MPSFSGYDRVGVENVAFTLRWFILGFSRKANDDPPHFFGYWCCSKRLLRRPEETEVVMIMSGSNKLPLAHLPDFSHTNNKSNYWIALMRAQQKSCQESPADKNFSRKKNLKQNWLRLSFPPRSKVKAVSSFFLAIGCHNFSGTVESTRWYRKLARPICLLLGIIAVFLYFYELDWKTSKKNWIDYRAKILKVS